MIKTLKQHIFRSPYQSLAAILVVSLSLFLMSVFFILGAASQRVLQYFESRPQVSAFLKDEAKPQEIELLRSRLESTGKIKKIDYISKEQALAIYREQNKDKPLLMEMVTAKILPASLEVSTLDLPSLKEIASLLKKEPLVEDVIIQEDVISALLVLTQTLRQVGLGIAGFLLLVAVLTILIVLGMKISQKREEIEILKLLGATWGNICSPFYAEGIVYGVSAALVSWGLSYSVILAAGPLLARFFSEIPLVPVPLLFMLELLGGTGALGIIVGILGTFLAISRFAKTIR